MPGNVIWGISDKQTNLLMVGNGVQLCQLRREIGPIVNSPFLSRGHCFSLLADKEDERGVYILPGTRSGTVATCS